MGMREKWGFPEREPDGNPGNEKRGLPGAKGSTGTPNV